MHVLRICHPAFDLTFTDDSVRGALRTARANGLGEDALTADYTFSAGVESVSIDGAAIGAKADAFFFDNTDYSVWVQFKAGAEGVKMERGDYPAAFKCVHQDGRTLSGWLNYGNDIGKSAFRFPYRAGGERRWFEFGYHVLSTKLDYHRDWRMIVDDIEEHYRMLSLDFLRKTYHSFQRTQKGETPDLIWWSLFSEHEEEFIRAVRFILANPRRRMKKRFEYALPERLQRLTPRLEHELAEGRHDESRRYFCEIDAFNNDTPENRFLKHAVETVAKRHAALAEKMARQNLTEEMRSRIEECSKTLKAFRAHPFFRTVGRFAGMTQESLVLQRAAGYAKVARIHAILKASYDLRDGLYKLQTKDIATLYEIWSFIQVRETVKRVCGLSEEEIEDANRAELNAKFVLDFSKGENSKVVFRKGGVELAELFYNTKVDEDGRLTHRDSFGGTVVPTGSAQKPDIILQLTKQLQGDHDFRLTYLFDAKYRLGERDADNNSDAPPDDAINQMHRYRDAIYYRDLDNGESLKREVVGGYILFPGKCDMAHINDLVYMRSISAVNIGAFPLRPGGEQDLLRKFIAGLIKDERGKDVQPEDVLRGINPHKGTYTALQPELGRDGILIVHAEKGSIATAIENCGICLSPVGKTSADAVRGIQLVIAPSTNSAKLFKVEKYLGEVAADEVNNFTGGHYKENSVRLPKAERYHAWKVRAMV